MYHAELAGARLSDRVRALAEELQGVAGWLDAGLIQQPAEPADQDIDPEATLHLALRLHRARERRGRHLRPEILGEPAWDMLLWLYIETRRQRSVSVSSLTCAASAPPTTALRYIGEMVERGELIRVPDPADRRRVWLKLTPATLIAVERCLMALA